MIRNVDVNVLRKSETSGVVNRVIVENETHTVKAKVLCREEAQKAQTGSPDF